MSSVRSGYSADWEAGVWPGYHHPLSRLARVETIWVMMTDSSIDRGGTSACLPHQIPHSPSHRLLADGLSQHGCRQVRDDHLAGKDRDSNRHEITPGRLPASLPGRLTDGQERGQNLAKAGLIVGRAHGVVTPVGGVVHLHDLVLSSTTGMVLGTNIDN